MTTNRLVGRQDGVFNSHFGPKVPASLIAKLLATICFFFKATFSLLFEQIVTISDDMIVPSQIVSTFSEWRMLWMINQQWP